MDKEGSHFVTFTSEQGRKEDISGRGNPCVKKECYDENIRYLVNVYKPSGLLSVYCVLKKCRVSANDECGLALLTRV